MFRQEGVDSHMQRKQIQVGVDSHIYPTKRSDWLPHANRRHDVWFHQGTDISNRNVLPPWTRLTGYKNETNLYEWRICILLTLVLILVSLPSKWRVSVHTSKNNDECTLRRNNDVRLWQVKYLLTGKILYDVCDFYRRKVSNASLFILFKKGCQPIFNTCEKLAIFGKPGWDGL